MEPMCSIDLLAAEIKRITSSSYPVSLKHLHDILAADTDGNCLKSYSASNPCSLKLLAACIIDRLAYQPFQVDLLRYLCASESFRMYILQFKPELLHILLTKAVEGHNEYKQLCIHILRYELPQDVALPASAELLFTVVVKDAVRDPSAEHLVTVYDLLSGACKHLPQVLPRHDWAKLQDGLIKIVKSTKTIQDQSLSLLCLGILQLLAQQAQTGTGAPSDASAFFSGSKALKSLDLAALQAVWITKPTRDVVQDDMLRKLAIVQHVVEAVPSEVLRSWTASAQGQGAVSRLASQCQDPASAVHVRLQASLLYAFYLYSANFGQLLSMLAKLYESQPLPMSLVSAAVSFLSQGHYLYVETNMSDSIGGLITSLLTTSAVEIFQLILRHVTQALTSNVTNTTMTSNLVLSLRAVTSTLINVPHVAEGLREELHSLDRQVLDQILAQNHVSVSSFPVCNAMSIECRKTLAQDFIVLCLTLDSTAPQTSQQSRLATNTKLLQYLRYEPKHPLCTCGCRPRLQSSLAYHEQQNPDPEFAQRNWRDSIRAFTKQEVDMQEQKLVAMVGTICGDLEERCQNAEKPYREAHQKVTHMQQEIAKLRGRNDDLEQEALDLQDRVRISETEKHDLQEALELENERLIERVQNLDQALKDSVEAAKAQLERTQAEFKARELQFRTTITEKEMLLDEAHSECETLRRLNNDAASTLNNFGLEAAEQVEAIERVQTSLQDKTQELDALQQAHRDLRQDHDDLATTRSSLENALENTRTELQQCRDYVQQLISDHAVEVGKSEQLLQEETAKHTIHVTELQQELRTKEHEFKQEKQQLKDNIETEELAKNELEQRCVEMDAAIHEQEKEIERLQDTVATRDEEVAEFQAMRQTLAVAIGHLPERKHPRKSVHYAPPIDRSPQSHRQSRRLTDKHNLSSPQGAQDVLHGGKTPQPNAVLSFDSISTDDASTSKRAKSHKPFKVPAVRQPRLSQVATPKGLKAQTHRLPLGDVSRSRGNRSPSRQAPASTKKMVTKDKYNEIAEPVEGYAGFDELDFGSEVFASTPFTPAVVATHNADGDDETMDE